ncbi:MAG: RNA polymerase-binding protein DksA, partial [Rhodobacterales bacterium]
MKADVLLLDGYTPRDNETFMSPQQLEYFRRKLLSWKADLLVETRE